MTDFQIGLVIVGAIAVAGVFIYNRLIERRERLRIERSFGAADADPLLAASEPQPRQSARREPPESARQEPREAHSDAPPPESARREPAEAAAAPRGQPASLPDEAIDCVIELSLRAPQRSAAFFEYWNPLSHRFAGQVMVSALSEDSGWRSAAEVESCTRIRAGLQLVSRQGPVSESDLLEFRSALDSVAAKLGASVSAPEIRSCVEAARALDGLCAEADIELVLHLKSRGQTALDGERAWDGALQAGLVPESDGALVYRDAAGRSLFSVAAAAGNSAISLALNVPRCADLARGYEAMVALAQQLATALDASIVDDNGAPIDTRALAQIGAQIDRVRRALDERGISAGSPLALRLFS
jgi:hypothetical protein